MACHRPPYLMVLVILMVSCGSYGSCGSCHSDAATRRRNLRQQGAREAVARLHGRCSSTLRGDRPPYSMVLVIPTPHAAEESATARRRETVASLHRQVLFDYCTATETFVV